MDPLPNHKYTLSTSCLGLNQSNGPEVCRQEHTATDTDDSSEVHTPDDAEARESIAAMAALMGSVNTYPGWMKDHASKSLDLSHGLLAADNYLEPKEYVDRSSESREQLQTYSFGVIMDSPQSNSSSGRNDTAPKPTTVTPEGPTTKQGKVKRGRPRLDNPLETAADRRRAQIRVAQRAYRLRKDTTISALEKRTQHLEKIIDGMNKTFLSLYDAASDCPELQAIPEVSTQLRKGVIEFLAYARQAQEESTEPEDPPALHGSTTARQHEAVVPQEEDTMPTTSNHIMPIIFARRPFRCP